MNVAPNALSGHTVVLTGKVLGVDRAQMHRHIRIAGGTSSDKVDRDTTILVVQGGGNGTKTTKVAKANKLGIPIISDATFHEVIEGRLSAQTAISAHIVGNPAPVAPKPQTAPAAPKVTKREVRQRAATVAQLDKLAATTSGGPYGIGF